MVHFDALISKIASLCDFLDPEFFLAQPCRSFLSSAIFARFAVALANQGNVFIYGYERARWRLLVSENNGEKLV